jgi:hypothetical protein
MYLNTDRVGLQMDEDDLEDGSVLGMKHEVGPGAYRPFADACAPNVREKIRFLNENLTCNENLRGRISSFVQPPGLFTIVNSGVERIKINLCTVSPVWATVEMERTAAHEASPTSYMNGNACVQGVNAILKSNPLQLLSSEPSSRQLAANMLIALDKMCDRMQARVYST